MRASPPVRGYFPAGAGAVVGFSPFEMRWYALQPSKPINSDATMSKIATKIMAHAPITEIAATFGVNVNTYRL